MKKTPATPRPRLQAALKPVEERARIVDPMLVFSTVFGIDRAVLVGWVALVCWVVVVIACEIMLDLRMRHLPRSLPATLWGISAGVTAVGATLACPFMFTFRETALWKAGSANFFGRHFMLTLPVGAAGAVVLALNRRFADLGPAGDLLGVGLLAMAGIMLLALALRILMGILE